MVDEQPSFTDIEYGNRRRVSRREKFLDMMDQTVPWDRWVAVIEPHYYQDRAGKRGRKPVPIETMLRMYLLQVWFSLSDEGVGGCDLRLLRDAPFHGPGLRASAGPRCDDAAA
ncbi:transposase, partial [Ornithinimicrobium sp. CNJ-824]|uniref:transposase n=1 Tax=Ornithinimicrobium sp. CNJ-824 TaxID=1904966 RepID=UPI001180EBFC